MQLTLVPLPLAEANAFVEQHHRHHGPVVGARFSIGAAVGEQIVGVAIVGRPVARGLQDGFTAEVVRLCTDSTPHAASKLYAAAWRAWRAMGGRRLVTYTLVTEPGTSLTAAGWRVVGEVRGANGQRRHARASKPRVSRRSTSCDGKRSRD